MNSPVRTPKKLHIKTYGCQMNVYDSERMADILRPLGYEMAETSDDADLVVLNTCHIREKASEKVYSEIGRLKEQRGEKEARGGGRMTIAIAGCVAQAEGQEIMNRAPAVDLVVGPQAYHQLPELIARTTRMKGERLAADFERGHLQPKVTASWEPRIASRTPGERGGLADLTDSAMAARLRVNEALDAMGPELAGVALDVCCFGKGLERVERERSWPARSAKLMLRTALLALARHYAPPPTNGRRRHAWGADGPEL